MNDKIFYAVMAQPTVLVDSQGQNVKVVCFPVPTAEPVKVTKHVRMFGYMNPVFNLYQIHEEKSGMLIGEGRTKEKAKDDVARFLREANEQMFFKQAELMGVATRHQKITYEEALAAFKVFARTRPSQVAARNRYL